MSNEKPESTDVDGSNDISKEILEKAGLESKPVNDYLHSHESDEHGSVLIRVGSVNMLEEDISQMDRSETILNKHELDQIIRESFVDTLRIIGNYVPQEKVQRLFPGLNLSELDSYDFSLSRVKAFILSNEDYAFFENNYGGDSKKEITGGLTIPTVLSTTAPDGSNRVDVNISERSVIIVTELLDETRDLLERTNGKLPRELTSPEKNLVALNIKENLVHELIHSLDISMDLPIPLCEGITEWYTRQIVNGVNSDEDIYRRIGIVGGYPNETQGVSILANAMLEGGVTPETIDRAFISSEPGSRQQIADFLSGRYGAEQAARIMEWKFKSSKESLQFIIDLESKQDSDVGRFLRTYRK